MSIHIPPTDCERAHWLYAALIRSNGDRFDLATLTDWVAFCRQKPIHRHTYPLPAGWSGLTLVFRDVDLVTVRAGLDPLRRIAVELHEYAHLLLGHLTVGADLPLLTDVQTQRAPLPQAFAAPALPSLSRLPGYAHPYEWSAELLATLLLPHVAEIALPPVTAPITQFHTALVQRAPVAHLPNAEALHATRCWIEINDVRDLVWSHTPQGFASVTEEAQQLRAWLHRGEPLAMSGPAQPVPEECCTPEYLAALAGEVLA